jgi:hypothetical protein
MKEKYSLKTTGKTFTFFNLEKAKKFARSLKRRVMLFDSKNKLLPYKN